MIATGTPRSTAHAAPPSGLENCTGKFEKADRREFMGSSSRARSGQSSGSRTAEPGRSPLRLRIIM
jgi:hypothetical protein